MLRDRDGLYPNRCDLWKSNSHPHYSLKGFNSSSRNIISLEGNIILDVGNTLRIYLHHLLELKVLLRQGHNNSKKEEKELNQQRKKPTTTIIKGFDYEKTSSVLYIWIASIENSPSCFFSSSLRTPPPLFPSTQFYRMRKSGRSCQHQSLANQKDKDK